MIVIACRRRGPCGFTLVEMLLASTLAAVLMAAVLGVAGALARDQRRMEARQGLAHSPAMFDLLRRDLTNGAAILPPTSADTIELIGHAGVDRKTLGLAQRLVHIRYRVVRESGGALVREQRFLDDPIRPRAGSELVATGVSRLTLIPISTDAEPVRLGDEIGDRLRAADGRRSEVPSATRVPSRLVVRVDFADGAVQREMVLR